MLKNKLSLVEYVNKVLKSNTFNKSIPEGFLSNINNKKIKINKSTNIEHIRSSAFNYDKDVYSKSSQLEFNL